jgi:hypothetical protein
MEWHTGYSIPIEGSNDIVSGFGRRHSGAYDRRN